VRVANELHDALSQMLFSVALKLDWCRHKLGPRSTTRAKLEEIRHDTGLMMTQIRRLISELSEAEAHDRTVSEKLRALVESFRELSGIPIDFNQRANPEVLGKLGQKVLYNAIQEALANVAKHARASHARVTLERDNNEVRFEVSDDGVGPPPGTRTSELSQRPGHFGLRQMRQRLEAAGGRIFLHARPGRGFILAGAVPVNNDSENRQDSERVR
jgi:signal transduction histidine kinase